MGLRTKWNRVCVLSLVRQHLWRIWDCVWSEQHAKESNDSLTKLGFWIPSLLPISLSPGEEISIPSLYFTKDTHCRRRETRVSLEYCAVASFPSYLGNESCTDFKYLSGSLRSIRMAESGNKGCNKFGLIADLLVREWTCLYITRTLSLASISGGIMVSVMADAAIYRSPEVKTWSRDY